MNGIFRIVFILVIAISISISAEKNLCIGKATYMVGALPYLTTGPEKATDGFVNTYTQSNTRVPFSLIVDLGDVSSVNRVRIIMARDNYATDYSIWTSTDSTSWFSVADTAGLSGGTITNNFALTNARYIKLEISSAHYSIQGDWGVAVYEFQAFDTFYVDTTVIPFDSTLIPFLSINRQTECGLLLNGVIGHIEPWNNFSQSVDRYRLSGWEDNGVGNWVNSYFTDFKIIDNDASNGVLLKKPFAFQTSGVITLEYRFWMDNKMDGVTWQLKSGDIPAVNIVTSNGNLCYKDKNNNNVVLQNYDANIRYGIKIEANITDSKANIFVNGVRKAEEVDFQNKVNLLNYYYFKTGDSPTGNIHHAPLGIIYKGYNVREKFLSVGPGSMPEDWTATTSGGTARAEELASSAAYDNRSMKLNDTSSISNITLEKQFAPVSGEVDFEYNFLLPVKTDGIEAIASDSSNPIIHLVTTGGNICFKSGKTEQIIETYRANIWYNVRVVANTTTHSAKIFINDMFKANVTLNASINGISNVRFATSLSNKGVLWVDDIVLNKRPNKPLDYVPVPVPVSTAPYIVGVQSCNLWLEGEHLGWDYAYTHRQRKPYLGWYDETIIESSDWQIKWMVEHGISFEMSCSYANLSDAPMKHPILEDGLTSRRRAEFADYYKFAIQDCGPTNNAAYTSAYSNHVIPYWIEHYFKDQRYMKIDNKPIVALLLGVVPAIYTAIQQQCQAAGFDGAIVVSTGRTGDYGYDYHWAPSPSRYDMFVPCVGFDPSAWANYGSNQCNMISEADFKTVLENGKISMDTISSNYLSSKMVLVSNWNEFTEGTFIQPSTFCGFGYVDAIRSVFSQDSVHSDAVPTIEQKARLDILYPRDWFKYQSGQSVIMESSVAVPASTEYCKNYPNPFNPATTIFYKLKTLSEATYTLSDISGSIIRQYQIPCGVISGSILWDGKDTNGKNVATGLYFGRLHAKNGFSIIHRMILLR